MTRSAEQIRKEHPDDIVLDGVLVAFDWGSWRLGGSIFVPTISPNTLKQGFNVVAKRYKYQLEFRVRVENEIYGVRIWRIL